MSESTYDRLSFLRCKRCGDRIRYHEVGRPPTYCAPCAGLERRVAQREYLQRRAARKAEVPLDDGLSIDTGLPEESTEEPVSIETVLPPEEVQALIFKVSERMSAAAAQGPVLRESAPSSARGPGDFLTPQELNEAREVLREYAEAHDVVLPVDLGEDSRFADETLGNIFGGEALAPRREDSGPGTDTVAEAPDAAGTATEIVDGGGDGAIPGPSGLPEEPRVEDA